MIRVTRRQVLGGSAAALVAALHRGPGAYAQSASAGPPAAQLVEDLVAANRILADQGVLDGYGHVSARHDRDPARFLMSRSLAPELVTAADILEYDLDSEPVDARGRTSYLERYIHGEIYRARPDVQAVVHSHSPSVIPFGVTGVPLRPLYHMSAFLAAGAPVWDIRAAAGGDTDMLVRTPALGRDHVARRRFLSEQFDFCLSLSEVSLVPFFGSMPFRVERTNLIWALPRQKDALADA